MTAYFLRFRANFAVMETGTSHWTSGGGMVSFSTLCVFLMEPSVPGRSGWSDVVPEITFSVPPSLSLKRITSTDSECKDNDQTLCFPVNTMKKLHLVLIVWFCLILVELGGSKHKNTTMFTNSLNLQPPPEIPGSPQCTPCMGVALCTQPQSPEGLEVMYQMLLIKWLKYDSEWASHHIAHCFL